MGALSRALLVSNGNVTQLVQKLAEGRAGPHRPLARRPPRLDRPADAPRAAPISPASPPPITTGSTRCSPAWMREARETLYHALGDAQALDRERTGIWILRPSSRPISTGIMRDGVATVTLNRPERKNPLTFESYAELRDTFRALVYAQRR